MLCLPSEFFFLPVPSKYFHYCANLMFSSLFTWFHDSPSNFDSRSIKLAKSNQKPREFWLNQQLSTIFFPKQSFYFYFLCWGNKSMARWGTKTKIIWKPKSDVVEGRMELNGRWWFENGRYIGVLWGNCFWGIGFVGLMAAVLSWSFINSFMNLASIIFWRITS